MDSKRQIDWELAGLGSEDGSLSGVGRQTGLASFAVNERLSADRQVLLWDLYEWNGESVTAMLHAVTRSADRALDRFVQIETAEDVLAFVSKYGPASICEHALPAAHNPGSDIHEIARYAQSPTAPACKVLKHESGSFAEHVGWYLDVAKIFRNVLDAEYKIRVWEQSRKTNEDQVEVRIALEKLSTGYSVKLAEISENYGSDAFGSACRLRLDDVVNRWIVAAGLALSIGLEENLGASGQRHVRRLKSDTLVSDGTSNLFGAVMSQLANVVVGKDPLETCSNCHKKYSPKRTPKWNQRNWCTAEQCTRAKNRFYQRNSRQKRRES